MNRAWCYITILFLLASCTAKRYLPEGELYFAGHELEYDKDAESVPRQLHNQIEDDLKPDPVYKIIRSRPAAWLYGVMGDVEKEKGIKHWLKFRIGTAPVFVGEVRRDRNAAYIESLLRSEGFFRAQVQAIIDSSKHEARVRYRIDQNAPYRISELSVCDEPSKICHEIDSLLQSSDLLPGKLFSRQALNTSREQIGNHFRSEGYFYFRPDFVQFQADSTGGGRTVRLRVGLAEGLPPSLLEVYEIDEVWLDLSGNYPVRDTIPGPVNVLLSVHNPFIKPEKLEPFIAIKQGDDYSLRDQRITLRQLNRLNIFEYVNLNYTSDTLNGTYKLRADLDGSPMKKQLVSTEFDINTTSNNFTGPGVHLEYNNRNLLRGAESLRITGIGRYETQLSGARRGLSSFEFDLQADLLVPRKGFIELRRQKPLGNVPRTKYGAQYRIFQQADFYAQSAAGVRYGVEWINGESHFHNLNIMSVSFLRLLSSSPALDELLEDNVFFRESFENQFIVGPNYTYTYNPAWKTGQRLRWFFSANIDLSGNVLNGIYTLLQGGLREPGDFTLGGIPFSQYTRVLIDNRFTYKLNRTSELVFRQNIGAGFAYGNSTAVPFVKQFFVGGAISMRAFQPRAIGPGSFFNEDQVFGSFFDQTGDYLAEFNLEYRFAKGGYFEGALFTDVGNVWLQRPSEGRPGGEFGWSKAVSELAVATGVGLRMDFTFVILRFDLAFPVRLPYLPEGERWIFEDINPLRRDWRSENLLLNIAIGYPF